jgi:hypothetical protein
LQSLQTVKYHSEANAVAIENPEVLDPALYPELAQSGGLSPALQRIFDGLSADLHVTKVEGVVSPGWAFVREGSRQSQIVAALIKRNFHVDFWYQGVYYGSGGASDLTEVATAIVAFHLENVSIHQMASRFVWLKPNKQVLSHQRGAEFFVTECWQDLERWLIADRPPLVDQLLPLVLEAAKQPDLRGLLPFTSHNRLCFSRTTGYPYSYDCPLAWPVEDGLFRVAAADEQTVLGEGDAARAAVILAVNLPKNCGSAINGTAEDLERPALV